ncbi:hypothetical protein D4764_0260860 [Takifugu flavidus]|uniref:Uncharacterized protein n=1 Tax=Takifugu flavidus TaxID=433684 RepID=A0A5C6MDJ9_9TELE|nr:hypothetical protein D4764_0260860 [Takifugu flavidus]
MTAKSAFLKRVDLTVVGDGVPTAHPYDPTPGERSVLLQCPVLSDSENPTSLDDLNSRCCGSRSVGPFFSFHCRNNVEVDENNLKRCRSSVFSNICSSGDLCCSVGKCEQTCGNCSEPKNEAAVLSCTTGASDEDTQPTEEEMCYSAPVFTRSKAQPDRGRLKDKETVYSECPVLSDSENPTSLDDLNNCCCGSRSVGPFFSFHCRNNVEVDENNLNRSRNSVFSNICSSGDLCFSVGKCEQTWGNCSEPEIEVKIKDCHIISTVLYTLGAAVSVGLIVLFIYLRTEQKNNLCGCCTAAVLSCTTGASDEDTQPTEEEMCFCSSLHQEQSSTRQRSSQRQESTLK